MSSSTNIIIVLMIAYALITIGIGVYSNRQVHIGDGRSEYFVAGGTLSTFVIFFTYMATFISAYGFVGLSAVFYGAGIEWVWFEAILYPAVYIPLTILITLRIYKLGKMHGYITNSDLVVHRLGPETSSIVRVVFGFIMTFYPNLFLVGVQMIGMSAVISGLTGGELSYRFVLFFFAIIMLLYIVIGGMRSVAYTDVFQGASMLGILIVILFIVYNHWGSFGEMFREAGTGPNASAFDNSLPIVYIPTMLLFCAHWAGLIPHLWVRMYAAKSYKACIGAGLGVGIGGIVMYSLMPLLAGSALLAFYPVAPELAVSEEIVAMMFAEWVGPVAAAILMFGLVASGKSTADSILLNLSSILQVDILEKTFKVKWSDRTNDIISRLMVALVLLVAVIAAISPELPIVMIAITLVWPGLAVLGYPILIMLFYKRANKYGVLAGLMSGFISLILFIYVIWPEWPHNPFGLWEGALPTIIGIVVTFAVSLLTKPPSKELIESFYGKPSLIKGKAE